jgi:hypothetical protein
MESGRDGFSRTEKVDVLSTPAAGEGKEGGAGERKVLTGEKPAAEFLDAVREQLAGDDSRRQASTSRRRFVASPAASAASRLHLTSFCLALQQQLLLGFDPEGDTGIGSHRVGWAGE